MMAVKVCEQAEKGRSIECNNPGFRVRFRKTALGKENLDGSRRFL